MAGKHPHALGERVVSDAPIRAQLDSSEDAMPACADACASETRPRISLAGKIPI